MADSRGRRAVTTLSFNHRSVSRRLADYLTGVTFTDIAAGESDSISIDLYNVDAKWLNGWYPTKGDSIQGGIRYINWIPGKPEIKVYCGSYVLDSIKFSGGPMACSFGGLAMPAASSFKTRQRTKTWKNVTLDKILSEIAKRYKLGSTYNANTIKIDSLEQTERTDADFLSSTVKDYGLKLKIYNKKLVIFDAGRLEKKDPVDTIRRRDWIDDGWDYQDELEGTYTGAIIKYKPDKGDEIKVTVGNANEASSKARVLYINTKCDSRAEAILKAKAKLNESNEGMTKLSGTIWGRPKLAAGVTVRVTGLGKASGKYFIDKITTEVGDGTTMKVEMHKCYKRF